MSNNLGPDQDRHSVGVELGPNWLQKVISSKERSGKLQGKYGSSCVLVQTLSINWNCQPLA